MCAEYIEEELEEDQAAETGLEEYMREYDTRQVLVTRHNDFLDKRCPVVLH